MKLVCVSVVLQNFGGAGRVPINAALFDEPLPAKSAWVAVHLRAVAAVGELREIVCGNHAELAQIGEGLDFRFPQGVLAVATAVNRSRAVVSIARQSRFLIPAAIRSSALAGIS